ncbi:hypothetical protein [Metabacillus fastidiosus]|uniref:Uncharacterized protein n=1 Tax=Metabacillus fastidiosus TaxID=1458 RepID=A0ABU6P598_9BACI|nr:hypothetical protein [Metabacillus fastidiosus]
MKKYDNLQFEDIEVGKLYKLMTYESKYKPYEIVYVIDKSYDDIDHSGNLVPLITYEYIGILGETRVHWQSPSAFRTFREPHCWKCKKNLFESKMGKCKKCGWIVCPDDNSCKCNYKSS